MAVDEIELRPALLEDAQALALVAAATFLEAFAGALPIAAILAHCARNNSLQAWQKYLAAPGCRACLAVAANGGAPVGYTLLTPPDFPIPITPADLELKRIYLFSRFHGTGLAQRLMDQAVESAVQMSARRLLLGVYAENHRALTFYRRNRFQEAGTRTFQVGDLLCHDLILARHL